MSWRRAGALAIALVATGCGDGGSDGPRAPIDLIVDKLGVTHVYGRSDHDTFYGAGYAMARDRLFQMELFRRQAYGTQSELLGPDTLQGDIAARVIGFIQLGAADAARVRRERPDEAVLMDAWAAGVNRRIDEVRRGVAPRPYGLGPAELDVVPAPWSAEDAFAVGKTLAFSVSDTLDSELLASVVRTIVPDVAAHFPLSLPSYDTFIVGPPATHGGRTPPRPPSPPARLITPPAALPRPYRPVWRGVDSNNWAVDGAHSATGTPFVCGDPHQPLTSPSRLWPVHLSSVDGGGAYDVIGFAFPGTPAVNLGHNAHVGWTATTNYGDAMDLWDVALDNDRRHVTLGDGRHAVTSHVETVHVKGMDDVRVTVEVVDGHGVILPPEMLPVPTYLFAAGDVLLNWTGFAATRESSSYLAINRAQNLDELEAAVDLSDVGAVNFIAADRDGITYRSHAAIPDRGDPSTHEMPTHILQATDAASFWTGQMLPLEKLPHLRAPARGFLASGNNDPFGFTADGDVSNDPWYYGAFYATGVRPYRVEAQLTALTADGGKVTQKDMQDLQNDVYSTYADSLVSHLNDAMVAIGQDPALAAFVGRADLAELAARLAAWDRHMDAAAGEPLLYVAVQWFAVQRAFADQLTSILFSAIASRSPPYLVGALHNVLEHRFADADRYLPNGENALVVGALDDAAAWLTQRFGTLDAGAWKLGDVNGAAFTNPFGHDLDPPRDAVSGGLDTLHVVETAFFDDMGAPLEQWTANEMSLYRMVIGFGDDGVPEATLNFARGASEEPSSPHFGDQQAAWLAGTYQPLPFRRADVDAATESKATLQ